LRAVTGINRCDKVNSASVDPHKGLTVDGRAAVQSAAVQDA
jgi:hypothetical protein